MTIPNIKAYQATNCLRRWECKLAINYSALALGKCVVGICITSHWFACLWSLQTIIFDGPVASVPLFGTTGEFAEHAEVDAAHTYDDMVFVDTWMGHQKYCVATGDRNDGVVPSKCINPWPMYCASLYWAIMTITSIGYGDIAATPLNAAEQFITAVLMMLGGFLWGQVIGTFCGVIATFDPHGAEFRRNMDDLNVFMSNKRLPDDMRRRLREYFHQTKHLQMSNAQNHLYRMMSPSLQGEVAWAANSKWLERIPFLQKCGTDFKVELAMQLTARVFAPGERAPGGHLYIINRGLALYGARVLTAGRIWGDDVILGSDQLRSRFCARAMNYLEAYTIDRDTLFAVAENYPKSYRAIRRCALLMAMKRRMALNVRLMSSNDDAVLRRKSSASQLGLRMEGLLGGIPETEAGEKEVVALGRLDPLEKDAEPGPSTLAGGATELAGGATDDRDSPLLLALDARSEREETSRADLGTSGDSSGRGTPSMATWQQAQAASQASMLRVESTLAALTEALGKVQAQQQASAERTESGIAALTSTIKEIQNVQQNYLRHVGSPDACSPGALGRARAAASSGGGGEASSPAVQQAAGVLLAPIVRRRRVPRGSSSHHNASSHTPPSALSLAASGASEAGAKVQPSSPRSPRTFSS